MKSIVRKRAAVLVLIALLLVPVVSEAQFGGGIVYDPTNYHNALLRYYQLQQHLVELQKNVAKVTSHLQLALQMAQYIHNMPARYRAVFSQWRAFTSGDIYGNTDSLGRRRQWRGTANHQPRLPTGHRSVLGL